MASLRTVLPQTAATESAASASQREEALLGAAHRWGERSRTRQNGLVQLALCETDCEETRLTIQKLEIEGNLAFGETFIAKARVQEVCLRISACQKQGRYLAAQYTDLLEKARQACCDSKDKEQILLAARNLRECKRAIEDNKALEAAAEADWNLQVQQEKEATLKHADLARQLDDARKRLEWQERVLAETQRAVLTPEALEMFQEAAVAAMLNLLD